ncbi:hypothetical protein Tco_0956230 [Tanacetum coccineum]|uniref:Uncharacterized protein n=1 Tax=Tanacetum coccineum TaxID=301880 RepID=A0ABQ5E9F0_9ASTR
MVVQNQTKLGEGSAIRIDPHHTPTIIESSSQPQKTQKLRKPKRKDTRVPQHSSPAKHIADEVVHKELGDSLVRAATTASSLEAEQDSSNITKTRSKATPNESSSLGTTSGGGPRRQETMRDTIAQTRFENFEKEGQDNVNAASTNEVNAVGGKTSIELPLDPNMAELEDYSIIHKDHPLDQVIGDLQSATQTRRIQESLVKMVEKPKKVIHALKDPSWIEAMQEEIDIMAVQEIDSGCKFHNRSCICGYFKLLWISALDSESTN